MKKLIIYPYKMGSESAKKLAQNTNARRVFANGRYVPKVNQVILNWGSSVNPNWRDIAIRRGVTILNKPENVALATNKLQSFYKWCESGISIPPFTTDINVAKYWIENGKRVFARQQLAAHSGRGIVVMETPEELVSAPLYTQYIKKKWEFRVHVFQGQVIDYAQKRQRQGFEGGNKYIRNLANGWVFCRENIDHFDDVKELAVKATAALGLDFAAIDAIRTESGKVYILEANTAAGLEGTTLERYISTISTLIGTNNNIHARAAQQAAASRASDEWRGYAVRR